MNDKVVVDASLAAMWGVPEIHTDRALALAEKWAVENIIPIAPCLLMTEVANAFYKRVVRREIDLKAALSALDIVFEFSIEIHEEPGLHSHAMELAARLGRPSSYDCHYLALAEASNCELWTGDRKFFNAVTRSMPRVRWIGDFR